MDKPHSYCSRWRWFKWLGMLGAGLAITYFFLPKPDLLPPNIRYSRAVLDRNGKVIFLTTTSDGKLRLPATFDQIPPALLAATLEMEDRRFFSHHGVDGKSLLRAVWGVLSRRKLGGASTLTMQLSRLRWGLKTRSVWGKLEQMFRAIQLERHYSKEEIAAAYFTLAPYGGNVEGARAASFRWCGVPASEITLRQAASLSVIPQRPSTRRPKAGGNPLQAAAQARLMARLRANHGEPLNELDAEFHLEPTAIPRETPHLARRVLREQSKSLTVSTTVDPDQQRIIEKSIREFLRRWSSQGLRNASAILLHAPTREIRACVGSANFHDANISGQVDGTRAGRSPGSTLKPFIYALALDAGIIQPQTLMDDAPKRFSAYNPENSDRNFLGPIPAGEALRLSRNVPAVELANRLPNGGLEAFLWASGVNLPRESPGLALAIGATEMSLEELARLYAELAHPQQGKISPSACWLTLDALRSKEPGAPAGLSCKTGTSNGFRDAWACGVMGDWVLCVWVGHFDGHGMPGLFARDTAAPLLWQTVTKLKLPARRAADSRPQDVVEVSVCAVSGDLAGKHCQHCRKGWFIGGVSPITSCQVHQRMGDTVVEVWSAERLAQFKKAGFPRAVNPLANLSQTPALTASIGYPPKIISPQSTLTYYVQANAPDQSRLLLQANAAPSTRNIHWFADNRYLGATPPDEPLPWQPIVGDYELQAMDDAGRASVARIRVRLAIGK